LRLTAGLAPDPVRTLILKFSFLPPPFEKLTTIGCSPIRSEPSAFKTEVIIISIVTLSCHSAITSPVQRLQRIQSAPRTCQPRPPQYARRHSSRWWLTRDLFCCCPPASDCRIKLARLTMTGSFCHLFPRERPRIGSRWDRGQAPVSMGQNLH
jgi:hypothetical protein